MAKGSTETLIEIIRMALAGRCGGGMNIYFSIMTRIWSLVLNTTYMEPKYRAVMQESFVLIKHKCYVFTTVEIKYIKFELLGIQVPFTANLPLN